MNPKKTILIKLDENIHKILKKIKKEAKISMDNFVNEAIKAKLEAYHGTAPLIKTEEKQIQDLVRVIERETIAKFAKKYALHLDEDAVNFLAQDFNHYFIYVLLQINVSFISYKKLAAYAKLPVTEVSSICRQLEKYNIITTKNDGAQRCQREVIVSSCKNYMKKYKKSFVQHSKMIEEMGDVLIHRQFTRICLPSEFKEFSDGLQEYIDTLLIGSSEEDNPKYKAYYFEFKTSDVNQALRIK
jgi:hypothetical protein